MSRDLSELRFSVAEASALSDRKRGELFGLFEKNYRQADPAFLTKSLATLRHVATATHDGVAVGFALAETRVLDLPRLPEQVVYLAGICCVAPEFRRRGVFGELERRALSANPISAGPRRLFCGRMAHPAAHRTVGRLPGSVPRAGVRPTAWQRAVGKVIAEAYGVHGFDPETFVCLGSGTPIGYPRMALDVEPHEWKLFEAVDRDRGDALLALGWAPDPPPGW